MRIRQLIKDIFMFKALEDREMEIVIDSMEKKEFKSNDMVIT